jgi:hypothetical protein
VDGEGKVSSLVSVFGLHEGIGKGYVCVDFEDGPSIHHVKLHYIVIGGSPNRPRPLHIEFKEIETDHQEFVPLLEYPEVKKQVLVYILAQINEMTTKK